MFDPRSFIHRQGARAAVLRQRVASASLVIATTLLCQPALADLPTQTTPAGVEQGDILGMWRYYAKTGFNILILLGGVWAFWLVASSAMEKYRHYGKGKIEMSEMKEHIIVGLLVLVVAVALFTVANTIL